MKDTQETGWQSIEYALREALSLTRNLLQTAGLNVQAEDIEVLLDAGEYSVALEQLCSHLQEINRPFSRRIYELIDYAGTQMEMDPSTWADLSRLIETGEMG